MPNFVLDNRLIWLGLSKIGSPPQWQNGVQYGLGDTVVPSAAFLAQNPLFPTDVMFQVVGFTGKSNTSHPVFPTVAAGVVVDNQVKWLRLDPTQNPPALPYDQYYFLAPTVVVIQG